MSIKTLHIAYFIALGVVTIVASPEDITSKSEHEMFEATFDSLDAILKENGHSTLPSVPHMIQPKLLMWF